MSDFQRELAENRSVVVEGRDIATHVFPSADYKFYHKSKSIVVPRMKGRDKPWRYPFGDIFIYSYNKSHRVLAYRNQWEKSLPGIGYNATLK